MVFQAVVSHYKVISLEGCGFSGGCNIFSRVDEVGKGKGTSPRHMALGWPFRPLRRLSSTLLAGSRAICSVWQAQVFLPTRVSSKMAVPIALFFVDHNSKSPDFGNAAHRKATWGLLVHQAIQRTHAYKRPFPVSMDDVIWRVERMLSKCREDVMVRQACCFCSQLPADLASDEWWAVTKSLTSNLFSSIFFSPLAMGYTKSENICQQRKKSGLAVEHRLGILRLLTVATPALEDTWPEAIWKLTMDFRKGL